MVKYGVERTRLKGRQREAQKRRRAESLHEEVGTKKSGPGGMGGGDPRTPALAPVVP